MPYQSGDRYERASPLGHVPTVKNELVAERLRHYRRPGKPDSSPHRDRVSELLVPVNEIPGEDRDVRWVLGVDGTQFEQEVDPAFPSTRLLFLQVGGVVVDLLRMRERRYGFADPAAIAAAQDGGVFAGFLPSSNLASDEHTDPVRAFRFELDGLFRDTTVHGRTLLDMLLEVEAVRTASAAPVAASGRAPRCPAEGCQQPLPDSIPSEGATCSCGEPLLPIDVLRLHESFDPWGSNAEAAGRAMGVSEHLTLAAFGKWCFEEQPSIYGQLALIHDGPLAMFGEAAKLRSGLLPFWQTMAAKLAAKGLPAPMLLGIEKTGEFVDHAKNLGELLPPAHLMRLPLDYIREFIRFRDSSYGKETYYARKFIYRTADERVMVVTVPPLSMVGELPYGDGGVDALEHYPTLRPICALLDRIGTRLYDDAVIPVALAHGWTAYPLRTAGTVLKLHAIEHLGQGSSQVATRTAR